MSKENRVSDELAPPKGLPPAYGGCTCSCHHVPGIMHMTACCSPLSFTMPTYPEWYREKAKLEEGCVISAGAPDPIPETAPTAEEERDALLAALGFRPGPLGSARDVILKDAAGLRPEMVRARNAERELKSDRDWDRMAAAELLRKWVRRKFGPWITWRTAWAAVDEILPGRQALSEGEQT